MVSSSESSSLLCSFLCRLDARCMRKPSALRMSTPLQRRHVRGGPFLNSSFGAVNQFLHVQFRQHSIAHPSYLDTAS